MFVKCECQCCSGHLEFDHGDDGTRITCPHCGRKTTLRNPYRVKISLPTPPASRPTRTTVGPPPVPQPTAAATVGKIFSVGCLGLILLVIIWVIIGEVAGDGGSGGSVIQSSWDGSVSQVKAWLKENAKDPDSIQFIEWSPLEKVESGYRVRVKYRGKNGFGGYEIEEKVFIMDLRGNVLAFKTFGD